MEMIDQKIIPIAQTRQPDEILSVSEFDAVFLKEMFVAAKKAGASDIYITPYQNPETWDIDLEVNFLVHDEKELYKRIEADPTLRKSITTKMKVLSRCDLSTTEKMQDRAFSLKTIKTRYRLAVNATEFGEAFVLRPISDKIPTIDDCNLHPETRRDFLWAISQKKGLILITGPTGSGKSTTLQAGIMELPRQKKEVLAVEDPVERIVPYVKHIPITNNVTWHHAIKSALRSKPHVILIGEIRDSESASLALEAANTGHLVLSTLHTNSVAGTVDRLLEMGVKRSVLADNLLFATGQELVQTLCSNCRQKGKRGFIRGDGCNECKGRGITGLIPLVEYCTKPDRDSIVNFNMKEFEKKELKVSFKSESERLVNQGMIDERGLERYGTN